MCNGEEERYKANLQNQAGSGTWRIMERSLNLMLGEMGSV